jgi:hypothetical protein
VAVSGGGGADGFCWQLVRVNARAKTMLVSTAPLISHDLLIKSFLSEALL